jgi:hypothetical protein
MGPSMDLATEMWTFARREIAAERVSSWTGRPTDAAAAPPNKRKGRVRPAIVGDWIGEEEEI